MITARVVLSAVPRRALLKRELSALVSAVDEFPGLPSTSPEPSKASKSSISTLPNGLTVVSEDSASTTTVSLTFPNAGSASESVGESGAALANKCLAFKSGSGLSSALILRNLEDDGAVPFATAGRTSATVGFTCAPDKAARLIPLLATTCSYEKWDVRDAIAGANMEVEDAGANAQVVLTEELFGAAYGSQSPMGKPFYTAGATSSTIKSFREKAYGLSGAVLAATGVPDHQAFCTAVQERLAESYVGGGETAAPAATYIGGEARVHAPSVGSPIVALAFSGPSDSVMSAVLKECLSLSGASSFGAGGLVGVYGSDTDALSEAVTTKPSGDVITRAVQLAKSKTLFALEEGSKELAEAMTAQVLESGTFDASGAAFDSLSAKDVTAAYDAMIKSGLTLAAVGDLSSVPYHATVASRFS